MQLKAYYIDFESFVMFVLESDMYYCLMYSVLYVCANMALDATMVSFATSYLYILFCIIIVDFGDLSLNGSTMVAARMSYFLMPTFVCTAAITPPQLRQHTQRRKQHQMTMHGNSAFL